MNIEKIDFYTKPHSFDPSQTVLFGEYKLTQELTLSSSDFQLKDKAKQLICESIERQASHDIMGVSFARSLGEESRMLIIDSLMRVNMDYNYSLLYHKLMSLRQLSNRDHIKHQ